MFGGLRLDFNRTKATEVSQQMAEDPWIVEQGTDIQNSGIGIILQYDSRDFEVNANSGLLLNFVGTFYGNPINSDFEYRMFILDYRQFKTIFRKGRILAWEVKIYNGSGDIPWANLARIGTTFDLRGYRFGQYRDKTAGFGILEYRHTFRKMRAADKKLTPHRLVLWVGAGSLGERIDEWNDWLPNFGIGYRFEVQPNINARIDFGFGAESSGFYINFNEAF
jgi:outer membrane protein assembly factor BamA